MRRTATAIVGVALVAGVILAAVLWSQERGGPPHFDVMLSGDVPATAYLPGDPVRDPPPVVVVGHGYSGDRTTMSSFARSLAEAGYAVVAVDFRGHGANENPSGDDGGRAEDLAAAVAWAASAEEVNGSRVALLGHSMGAGAALDVAAEDPRVDATIVLGSGRREAAGAERPPNVLFLVAESDPDSIRRASIAFAADLAGREVPYGTTSGNPAEGDAVRAAEIEGADHIRILWASRAVAETVSWLDAANGVDRAAPAGIEDPRLGTAGLYLLCALVLLGGLGWAAGTLAPSSPAETSGSGWRGLVVVAGALAGAAPVTLLDAGPPFLPPGFGDVVAYLGAAGLLLGLVVFAGGRPVTRLSEAWTGPSPASWPPVARTTLVAGAALAVAFVLVAPLGGVFHRLAPTPERLVLGAMTAVLLTVFFVPFQTILRRGGGRAGAAASAAGHVLVLVALAAGVMAGALPGIVALALPLLLGVFALVEVFALPAYARGRNSLLAGIVEALWVAGLVSVTMPAV